MNNKYARLVAGAILQLFMGLVYAWSIFRAPLTAVFPLWSATQVSLTFTICMICWCLGGFFGGRLTAKIPQRFIIRVAACVMLVGFAFISFLLDGEAPGRSLWTLYIGYGVIVGFTDGMIYNSVMSCVLKSFPGKAGTISGILLFGFGFGSLALGSLIGALAGAAGIKWTFLILGAIMFVVIIICSLFMTLPSEAEIAAQQKAAAPGGTAGSTKPVHDYTTVQMIKTPAFWFNCLWQIAMAVAGLVIVNSAANIAVYFGLPALLGMIVSVFNGLGRPLEGVFFDKLGRNGGMNIDTVFMFAGAVVLLIALATGVGALVFVGLALVGLGYGGSPAAASATINGFYGPKNYGMNFAAANFIMIPSAIIGPLFSSWLQEISGGQFYSTFVMIAIAAVLAFLLNLGVTITARKGGLEVRA